MRSGGRRPSWLVALTIVVVVAIVAGGIAIFASARDDSNKPEGPSANRNPPTALTVNGDDAPVGVDPDQVAFAWHVTDARPNAKQVAYRLLVSKKPDPSPNASVVWDQARRSGQQAFVGYGGPRLAPDTQYWWTVQTTTVVRSASTAQNPDARVGSFARVQSFVTGLRATDWSAHWVRPGPEKPGADDYTYLRKEAHLNASPIVRATAYVAALHQYQLFLNGKKVAAGPSYSYPDAPYYEATDVTGALRAGADNAVGVLHYWNGPGQGRPAGRPALLVQISVVHANGTRDSIGTDGSWTEHSAEWMPAPPRNDEGGFTERVDGRRQPQGWAQPGFDAIGWTPAPAIAPTAGSPALPAVAQRTHIVEQAAKPVSVRTLPSGAVVADYGAIIAARPSVTFAEGVNGRTIEMHAGFALDPDGHVSTTHATQATDMSFSYIERTGAQSFEAYTYLGFRYLEVDAPGEKLDPARLVVYARHAALPDEQAASFTSSVPMLDKVWAMLRHTALYVSQEQFVDTPTREKGQFLTDSFNDSLATMHTFGEQNLTRQALEDFAQSQARYYPDGNLNAVYPNGDGRRFFIDSTMRYPEWVWQYYLATGDRKTLSELSPVLHRVSMYVSTLIDARTGLVTFDPTDDGADLVDWPPAMRYGYDVDTVARTTTNVLAADVFQRVADIGAVIGDAGLFVGGQQGRHDQLVAAINAKLTRPDGVYVDGLKVDGSPSSHASQQASEFALAFGVVPSAKVAVVGKYVAGLGVKTGPMDGLYLLDGLQAAGRAADVVKVLTDAKDPGWAHVVAQGGTFAWESWILYDVEGDGMSHGWGSSALLAFQTSILGVTPAIPNPAAGQTVVEIDAPTAGPDRVAGRIPTVAGPIDVRWERAGAHVSLDLTLPPNAAARVKIGDRVRVVGGGTYDLTSAA